MTPAKEPIKFVASPLLMMKNHHINFKESDFYVAFFFFFFLGGGVLSWEGLKKLQTEEAVNLLVFIDI